MAGETGRNRRRYAGRNEQSGAGRGRSGRWAAGSIGAAVAGMVIRDLLRPNSLIRGLIAYGRESLAARKAPVAAVDITRDVKVEVVPPRSSSGE